MLRGLLPRLTIPRRHVAGGPGLVETTNPRTGETIRKGRAMKTATDKRRRLAELRDDLAPAKDRLMRILQAMEDERLGATIAKRLGTIIGRLEDLQRKMR